NAFEALRYYFNKLDEDINGWHAKREITLDKVERKYFDKLLSNFEPLTFEDEKGQRVWDTETLKKIRELLKYNNSLDSRFNLNSNIGRNEKRPFYIREVISDKNKYGIINKYEFIFSTKTNFEIIKEDVERFVSKLDIKDKNDYDYFVQGQKILDKNYDFAEMIMERANWV